MALSSSFYDYPKPHTERTTLFQIDDEIPLICRVYPDSDGTGLNIPLFASPSEQTCKILYMSGIQTPVGKGANTCKSIELSNLTVKWTSEFINLCVSKVSKMLNDDKLKDLKPCKIIIYGPGDFFVADSTHTTGQNMTAICELVTEWESDKFKTEKNNVFDHNLPHEVNKITKGYRVLITFELIVE